jgi:hypothetical protein
MIGIKPGGTATNTGGIAPLGAAVLLAGLKKRFYINL